MPNSWLFNPADIDNVKAIQAKYEVKPLSAFLAFRLATQEMYSPTASVPSTETAPSQQRRRCSEAAAGACGSFYAPPPRRGYIGVRFGSILSKNSATSSVWATIESRCHVL
jgi:hypothetical protein